MTVEIETLRARLAALERDLAEGRRREQTLAESEARYRTLFEYSNDLIFSCTLDGIITNVNRATESTLGWSRQELIGEHVLKILTPASFRLGQERVHRTLAGERLAEVFNLEALGKDGSIVPLEGWARFIIGRDGAPVEHQGVYRDVSERTRAERGLWETEERHRSLPEGVARNQATLGDTMIADLDHRVRLQAFAFLAEQTQLHEVLPGAALPRASRSKAARTTDRALVSFPSTKG